MKNITYILAFALGITATQAQTISRDVVANAGETISNGTVTLDQTVGELAVTDITNGTTTLQQGFHQTRVELNIRLNPVAFLQGAGINPVAGEESLMRDNLRAAGLIPTTSPYDNSVTAVSTVFDVTGPDAIVDWVEVELRQGADNNNTTVVESASAFMQRDGDIVGLDGVSGLEFDIAPGDFYVAVNHRNHLGVLTNAPLSLGSSVFTADFTGDASFIKNGTTATVTLANGNLALIGGDTSENNLVTFDDVFLIFPLVGAAPDYRSEDTNMDGRMTFDDAFQITITNVGRAQQY